MSDVTCTVTGLDELERMLNELAPKAAKTAMRRAVRAGLAVFQEAAEAKAPRETGALASDINIKTSADGDEDSGSIEGITGPGKHEFYGIFQEHGTRFQQAQPFMTPAFGENTSKVIDVFVSSLKDAIEDLAIK